MEENKDNAPIEDKPQPQIFNQDARDAIEAAFDAFKAEEEKETTAPPPQEPAPQEQQADKPQEDKTFDVSKSQSVEEQPTERTEPEWKPEFKDHRTAEESYRHARKKMQEATEEAARLRREKEEIENYIRKMAESQPSPQQQPQKEQPQAPPLDKETLEAEFFKDPVGFMMALQDAANRHAIEQAETKITEKQRAARMAGLQQSMTARLQEHFDTSYPELKPIEPLATEFTERVRQDKDFMAPLVEKIKAAPPELKARRIFETSKAIMDEGVRRLRTELPGLIKPIIPGETQTERLHSGAPPIVPGGGKPHVTPGPSVETETPQSYMDQRNRHRERMMASRWAR